ncbi:MAG: FxLYD domain-containing protein [Rhizobiaceae bacterium]
MTVVCPSCETRFRDPPLELIKTRILQCSRCEHEWQMASGSTARIKMDAPALSPDLEDLVDNGNAIKTVQPVVMPNSLDNATSESSALYVDRAPGEAIKPRVSLFWPATVLACMMLLAGSVGLRDTIMQIAPNTTVIYQAAGLVSKTPGLEIGQVVTTRTNKDGIRQLIVRGEIKNVADNTVPVPPVRLTMRDKQNSNLYAWTVTANKASLKAGEKSRFTAIAHDFPDTSMNVDVEFAPTKVLDKASQP